MSDGITDGYKNAGEQYRQNVEKSKPRLSVACFAQAMEYKLQKNDHKPDWRDEEYHYLVTRLVDEVLELHDALDKAIELDKVHKQNQATPPDWMAVMDECADVANIAMMIWDKAQVDEQAETM